MIRRFDWPTMLPFFLASDCCKRAIVPAVRVSTPVIGCTHKADSKFLTVNNSKLDCAYTQIQNIRIRQWHCYAI